jgi:hypothetical protein
MSEELLAAKCAHGDETGGYDLETIRVKEIASNFIIWKIDDNSYNYLIFKTNVMCRDGWSEIGEVPYNRFV